MKQFSVLLAVIGVCLCSCERHEWESESPKSSDTINLFKHGEPSKEGEHKEGEDHAKPESEKKEGEAPAGE